MKRKREQKYDVQIRIKNVAQLNEAWALQGQRCWLVTRCSELEPARETKPHKSLRFVKKNVNNLWLALFCFCVHVQCRRADWGAQVSRAGYKMIYVSECVRRWGLQQCVHIRTFITSTYVPLWITHRQREAHPKELHASLNQQLLTPWCVYSNMFTCGGRRASILWGTIHFCYLRSMEMNFHKKPN